MGKIDCFEIIPWCVQIKVSKTKMAVTFLIMQIKYKKLLVF